MQTIFKNLLERYLTEIFGIFNIDAWDYFQILSDSDIEKMDDLDIDGIELLAMEHAFAINNAK